MIFIVKLMIWFHYLLERFDYVSCNKVRRKLLKGKIYERKEHV